MTGNGYLFDSDPTADFGSDRDDDTTLESDPQAYVPDAELPAVLDLQLTLRDAELIGALAPLEPTRARPQYAIDALRIGLLALRNAATQIDTEQLSRAGDRLLGDLQRAFDQQTKLSQEQTQQTLKEYFDPQSGRLSERIGRLVSDDGELAQLLRTQLHGDGSPLNKLLSEQLGRESPLMKQLDPEQATGLVARLRQTIGELLQKQQADVLKEFTLDNQQSALARLVRELTTKHGDLNKALQEKIDGVVQEFSLDQEDSALSRLVRNVDRAQRTISSEFSLDNDASGLSRLKGELMTVLSAHVKTNQDFQEEVKIALEKLTQRRELDAAGTQHGHDFEAAVVAFVTDQAQQRGDLAEATGNSTGTIRNCKKGDALLHFGPDSPAPGARIVFEAKEDQSYTAPRALTELDEAKKNRGADFGVFVWSKLAAPAGTKPLARYRNDLIVLWDAEDPATDPYLLAALEIARTCVTEFHRGSHGEEIDFEAVDRAINEIEKRAEGLDKVQTSAETIRTASEKILDRVRIDQKAFEKQLLILREKLAALRALSSSSS